MGDPITQGAVVSIFLGLAVKELFRWKENRNGRRPLSEATFVEYKSRVEQMMHDDPPRKHTELLQSLIRETQSNGRELQSHGKKLDTMIRNGRTTRP